MYGYKIVTKIVKEADVAKTIEIMTNGDPRDNYEDKYDLVAITPHKYRYIIGTYTVEEYLLTFKSIDKKGFW